MCPSPIDSSPASHARLFRDGDDWLVEDLGSRNGTLVNGVRISGPTAVGPGDVIGISASIVEVCGADTRRIESVDSGTRTILRPASAILGESKKAMSRPDITGPEELRRAADQLRVLVDVHQALADAMTIEELLDRRSGSGLRSPSSAARRDLPPAMTSELVRTASRSMEKTADEFPESQSLAGEVIGKGLAAVVYDTTTDARFLEAKSLLMAGVRSLVAAPAADRRRAPSG